MAVKRGGKIKSKMQQILTFRFQLYQHELKKGEHGFNMQENIMMREKANCFATILGISNLELDCSSGWLERFKVHHDISFKFCRNKFH